MDLFYTDCKDFEGNNLKQKQHNAGRFIIKYASENIYKRQNSDVIIINNKPQFKDNDIFFSISHTDIYAVVCFDKNPVGVDIEKIKPRDYEAISKKMNFKTKNNSADEFFTNWTMYEAQFKLGQKAKNSTTFKFKDNYIISAVSSETTDIKLNIYEIDCLKEKIISLK